MDTSFEHNALEQDIERLTRKIREQKEAPRSPEWTEKDVIKSAIQEHMQPQPATGAPQPSEPQTPPILPKYLQQESPEIRLKVEELIDIAFHKGIEASVKEAGKYGPFILDALHDSLTSKLYEELKNRKLI